ncbi:MAG TPA: type II toxin-antitoxin system RelE/ParE family toxin [Parafilimonas sp.]|nr:type II toxin-antitoxin system RelE/ParE family toxin [Parafilimonas sp.]
MPCDITWMPNAINSYIKIIRYLQTNWTQKEIDKFQLLAEEKILNISNHPHLGVARNYKNPDVRYTLIHRRVALIYKHNQDKKSIELLLFWNTSQNPKRIKKLFE